MRMIRLLTLVPVLVLVTACGSTRPEDVPGYKELERARTAVARAEQTPGVGADATAELKRAQDALSRAEWQWHEEDGALSEEQADFVKTYAYMAERYSEAALARARAVKANQEWQSLVARNQDLANEARAANQARQQELDATRERLRRLEQELAALRNQGVTTQVEDRGLVITMTDVLFAFNSDEVGEQFGPMLDKLVQYLQENDARTVVVEGHTDSIGTAAYNASLSERRAEAVRGALLKRGANSAAVKAIGYGETRPVASNMNESGRRLNRRVELVVN